MSWNSSTPMTVTFLLQRRETWPHHDFRSYQIRDIRSDADVVDIEICASRIALGGQECHPHHHPGHHGEEAERTREEGPRGEARPLGKDGGHRDPGRRCRPRPQQHPRRHRRLPRPDPDGTIRRQPPAQRHHHHQELGREGRGHCPGSADPRAARRACHGARGTEPHHHGLPPEPRVPEAPLVPSRKSRSRAISPGICSPSRAPPCTFPRS